MEKELTKLIFGDILDPDILELLGNISNQKSLCNTY